MLKCRELGTSSWKNLPTPQSCEWGIQDLDSENAGRNQLGYMFRDRVAVKRKLTCNFAPLSNVEISTLLQNISSQFFELQYPDAQTGSTESMTVYVGDRSSPMLKYNNGNPEWRGLSVNFIER